MIIDAKTVVVTFLIIGVAVYFGLGAIRTFALSIAQENHDANAALDMSDEARRAKRERDADAAAATAFAKVEPLLPASVVGQAAPSSGGARLAAATELPQSAPSSGNSLNMGGAVLNVGDEEAPNAADI